MVMTNGGTVGNHRGLPDHDPKLRIGAARPTLPGLMHPILLNDRRVQQWRLGLEQEVAHILPRYQVALPGINAAPERAMAVGRRRGIGIDLGYCGLPE